MELEKNIEDFNLAFLDLETTGLDAVTGDAICEIGILKVKNRKVIDKFHKLINPGREIPQAAYNIHKISNEQVKDAPYFEQVADEFETFLNDCVICAYNVSFDMGFVNNHLKKMGRIPLNIPAIDILSMARDILKLSRYNLWATAKFFNIDCSAGLHRALGDSLVAYKVFFKLIDIFKEKGIKNLAEFVSLYGFGNEIFKEKENKKISLLREAVDKEEALRIRFFSFNNTVEEEPIKPLRVWQEDRFFCLLYQGQDKNAARIKLNRIFNVEPESRQLGS